MGRLIAALVVSLVACSQAAAQQPPSPIGPFVVDVRLNFPAFPADSSQLAASRGVAVTDLPGRGQGLALGAHVYVLKWRAVTIGLGGEVIMARSRSEPAQPAPATTTSPPTGSPPASTGTTKPAPPPFAGQGVTETFTSFAPQVSFNFGSGDGWSYLSGGMGPSVWSIVPGTVQPAPADQARLKTINYGGGARWFVKQRVAFTFDVRFWAVNPGMPNDELGFSPRTTLLVIGAGVSVR